MSAETIDGVSPPGAGDPRADRQPAPRRWPRRLAVAAAAVLLVCLAGTMIVAARYQPVVFGGGYRGPLGPHLVSKQINDAAGMQGQAYVPPQPPAHGSFLISLGNTGHFAVTIESVSLLPPGMPASAIGYGRPFRIDGEPTYSLEYLRHGQAQIASRRLAGAVLEPGEYIYVRIPILTARCWLHSSSWEFSSVWVTTRSFAWTHDAQISWTDPADPSQGAILSEEGYASPTAAPGLVCPR